MPGSIGVRVIGMGFLWGGGDGNVLLIVMMTIQLCDYTKPVEMYTLNG